MDSTHVGRCLPIWKLLCIIVSQLDWLVNPFIAGTGGKTLAVVGFLSPPHVQKAKLWLSCSLHWQAPSTCFPCLFFFFCFIYFWNSPFSNTGLWHLSHFSDKKIDIIDLIIKNEAFKQTLDRYQIYDHILKWRGTIPFMKNRHTMNHSSSGCIKKEIQLHTVYAFFFFFKSHSAITLVLPLHL